MLPSKGYYKGLDCPFYQWSLCKRPYCQFRHTKEIRSNEEVKAEEKSCEYYQRAIEKYEEEINKILSETENLKEKQEQYESESIDLNEEEEEQQPSNEKPEHDVLSTKDDRKEEPEVSSANDDLMEKPVQYVSSHNIGGSQSLFSKLVQEPRVRSKRIEIQYRPEPIKSKNEAASEKDKREGYEPSDVIFKPFGYSISKDPSTSPLYTPCLYSYTDDADSEGKSMPSYVPQGPFFKINPPVPEEKNSCNDSKEVKYDFEFQDDEITALLSIGDDEADEKMAGSKDSEVNSDVKEKRIEKENEREKSRESRKEKERDKEKERKRERDKERERRRERDKQKERERRQEEEKEGEKRHPSRHESSHHSSKRKRTRSRSRETEKIKLSKTVRETRREETKHKNNSKYIRKDVIVTEDIEDSEVEDEEESEEEMSNDDNNLGETEDVAEEQPIVIVGEILPDTDDEDILSAVEPEYSTVKKRVAHSSQVIADHSVLRDKVQKKQATSIKSLQATLAERYKKAQVIEAPAPLPVPKVAPIPGFSSRPVRIMAVPNAQRILLEKKRIEESLNQTKTIGHTNKHGRKAHVPASASNNMKHIISEGSKNVPATIRQHCYDKIFKEVSEVYLTQDERLDESIRLETELYNTYKHSKKGYQSGFAKVVMNLKRQKSRNNNRLATTLSHDLVLNGHHSNVSVISHKRLEMDDLSFDELYERLVGYKLADEQLMSNGFPIDTGTPGYAKCHLNMELQYYKKYNYIKRTDVNKRYCVRCSKEYEVNPMTLEQKDGVCVYHPGRKIGGGRNFERIYSCCNSNAEGCSTFNKHVTDSNDYENFPDCVKTCRSSKKPGIYALDCEMVYTRLGYELARVTVVNYKKEVVYDTYVKPKHIVECYNTEYSGITEDMLKNVKTRLKDVQRTLLEMVTESTILIGHSLDSDLRALHLIHSTVVDTSILFPVKSNGYKRSLRELCGTYLQKIIQENVSGHDSSEDAVASLELVYHKLKEDLAKYYS